MGRVHFCEVDYWPHNTCLYVTDFLGNDPLFAYYKLAELDLARYNSGSAQPSLNRNYIYGMRLTVPEPHVQSQIARTVRNFDRKIDLNRHINQTLEAMAQALFKSWFVDFDPVKGKIAAKSTLTPALSQREREEKVLRAAMSAISGKSDAELDALKLLPSPSGESEARGAKPAGGEGATRRAYDDLAATAALFPDEMEESELGEIPRGWRVRAMPDCIDVNPSRILKKGVAARYLDMANVPTNSARVQNVLLREFTSGSKFRNGDTLLARITPCLENGKTAFVDFLDGDEIGWGSTEFIVFRPKNGLPESLAYFLCRDPVFRAFVISQMARTSGRQRVPNNCFGGYKLVEPSAAVATEFGRISGAALNQIKALDEEAKTLASLRDTLLPKLLSGKLSVTEAIAEADA